MITVPFGGYGRLEFTDCRAAFATMDVRLMATMTTDHTTAAPARAGDEEILETLQERMERIIRGESPNAGRFCGYCYARLDPAHETCPVCGRALAAAGTLPRVPRAALRVYNAYRRAMRLWVNVFAFLGILIAVVLFLVMITYIPNPWVWFSLPVLFFGSYYLANVLGGGIGATLGERRGRPARAALWRELLERRATGENLDA